MSKLLLDEYPLLVLPSLATKIGLNEAIMMQQMHYWISKGGKKREGRKWVYNTYEEWGEQFPFWSRNTIRRIIKSLEDKNLVLSSKFNKIGIDNTKWYAINYETLESLSYQSAQLGQTSDQNEQTMCSTWADNVPNMGRPLPETNTETTSETKKNKTDQQAAPKNDYSTEFESFWTSYPRKVDKKQAYRKWKEALKNHTAEDIMNGVAGYNQHIKKNKTETTYIKHAKTFLGNESFKDFTAGGTEHERNGRGTPETPVKSLSERANERRQHAYSGDVPM